MNGIPVQYKIQNTKHNRCVRNVRMLVPIDDTVSDTE